MKKLSLNSAVLYHLLPGVLILLIYVWITPIVNRMGYPSLMSLLFAALVGIVAELGHLLYLGYQINGRVSLKGVINSSQKVAAGKFALIVFVSLVIMIISAGGIIFFEGSIKQHLFSWLPQWYFFDNKLTAYSKEALLTTALIRLVLDGLIFPIVEELYFRGYLLNRLPDTLKYKPFLAALLFTVYHFWQPWNYGSILIAALLLVWPVWKFKNLYISITLHCIVNTLSALFFIAQVVHLK